MADVVFRRIHGHIVPIKMSKSQKEKLKGGAAVATGIGVSAIGGRVYKSALIQTAKFMDRGMEALRKGLAGNLVNGEIVNKSRMVRKAHEYAGINFGRAVATGRAAKATRLLFPAAGAGLIGYGAYKILKSDKRLQKTSPEVVAGTAASVAIFAPKAWQASKSAFGAGMALTDKAFKSAAMKRAFQFLSGL